MKLSDCEIKSDYISYALKYSKKIKDIDTAIPLAVQRNLSENGIEGLFVTVYYKESGIRFADIVSLATLISKGVNHDS